MKLIQSVRRHLQQGTLRHTVLHRLGFMPEYLRVRWYGASSPQQAARALAKWGRIFLAQSPGKHWVLSLGEGDELHRLLNLQLQREGVEFRSCRLEDLAGWDRDQVGGLLAVLCGYPDALRTSAAARVIAQHPHFSGIRFEYANGLDREKQLFEALDEYADTYFVSPVLLDQPNPYTLYEESLKHFEQKCGLRDFLDLYQLIKTVVINDVPGDIAEFGSFKGHSGYLIAQTLLALGSTKRLYMFDTFEEFPQEPLGLDHHWNQSHHVDFNEVRSKFGRFKNVTLVKGDFTQTLASSGLQQVALAYVDCDSYRATRFLFDALLPRQISTRGLLVCEDYGHPALLGNRTAVHQSLEGKAGLFQYFSQFSGLYITLKL